jgi:hypothetical protein
MPGRARDATCSAAMAVENADQICSRIAGDKSMMNDGEGRR